MKKVSFLKLVVSLAAQFFIAALPVLISGGPGWIQGWIFAVALYLKNPGLLAERFRRPGTGGEKKGISFTLGTPFPSYFANLNGGVRPPRRQAAYFVSTPLSLCWRIRMSSSYPVCALI